MPNPRNPKNWCSICGKFCKNNPNGLCSFHYRLKELQVYGETYHIDSFTSTHDRHKYQNVRNHAHRVMALHLVPKVCKACGYNKYVELCHIKGIATFNKNTKLSVVNHLDNLVYLCPTHHWELDNGQLKVGLPDGN